MAGTLSPMLVRENMCAPPSLLCFVFVVPGSHQLLMSRFGRFRSIVLMMKDLPKGVAFYRDGLGLPLLRSSDAMAEFDTGGTPLVLKAVEGEAKRSTGYSPFLCFDVADLDATLMKLLQLGASLDGPIKYPAYGKVAALRSPDGHMIGIFEPMLVEIMQV